MSDTRPALLYLTHRIPFPPNKGDKVRSFNILRQLARHHRVFLGTFVDHPDDHRHVEALGQWCAEVFAATLHPLPKRIASLNGLISGEALSLPYYRDARLAAWVRATLAQQGINRAVVFSGPMAQYLIEPRPARLVIDFCDVDSAKWTQYAAARPWPLSWLYRREGRRLLAFERAAAGAADSCVFVTGAEAALFREQAAEVADKVHVMQNGVDADYFAPDPALPSPYLSGRAVVLFTGAMDYWPNIDAVSWFADEVLPRLRACGQAVEFWIVGMNPGPAVQALAGAGITVTGTVPDVRPYLAHADVVVAPLRIARGIQNKVLEAMAMARPVVLTPEAGTGLNAQDGEECVIAEGAEAFAEHVGALLAAPERRARMGQAARQRVLQHYSWEAHLGMFDTLLADRGERAEAEVVA